MVEEDPCHIRARKYRHGIDRVLWRACPAAASRRGKPVERPG